MKNIFAVLLLSAFSLLIGGEKLHADRIKRIEQGLRSVNAIEGDQGWSLAERMAHYGTPGLGVAVIENYQIVWFKVYGVADRETGAPVKPTTFFQAGSISKPVAAYGALKMVQDGWLTLDGDINDKLKRWRLPDNEFTKDQKVNLTHLLSHTGGVTVHGFPGYAIDEPVPTVVQVLDGQPPANTAPIRVDQKPGQTRRYSGGGYTIVQLAMMDVAEASFPDLMRELVLAPLEMRRSAFDQPLPPELLKHAAAGVLPDGEAVRGKRHTYPEMAAAGLWTNAEDLARFAIEIQLALKGKGKALHRETAEKMMAPITPSGSRGFGLINLDGETYFEHGGWDEGFCAQLIAHRDKGYGVVVMINSNHPELMNELIQGVGLEYGWTGYKQHSQRPIPDEWLEKAPGRYRYSGDQAIVIKRNDGQLFMHYYGQEPWELIYTGDQRFVRREQRTPIAFTEKDGQITFNFILANGERQGHQRLDDHVKIPLQLLVEGSFEQAVAAYRAFKDQGEPSGSEGHLNNQGYDFIQKGRFETAIGLFRVACELYPGSANTWDSLAFGYQKKGDKANAIKYYRKALSLDPRFPSALAELKKLTETPTDR